MSYGNDINGRLNDIYHYDEKEKNKQKKKQAKQKLKLEKQKNLEKVIESHSLKYYGYFNIIFSLLIFLVLVFSLILSSIGLYQNKKLYNLLDNNKNITETSAFSLLDEITPYDTITDLTGTTWEFGNTVTMGDIPYIDNNILFNSNSSSFNTIAAEDFGSGIEVNYGGDLWVYQNGTWSNQAYRTITITGGTDATNSTLISWLQSNATMQQTTTQLTTPIISSRVLSAGSSAGATIIEWSAISDAEYYVIYKNNTILATINAYVDGLSITDYELSSVGSYQVQATNSSIFYSDSSLSNTITINGEQLSTPIISLNNFTLSWSAITNATKYQIYKNDSFLTTISTTTYIINSVGNYQVKAINDSLSSFRYLDSSLSNYATYSPSAITTPTLEGGILYSSGYGLAWSSSILPNLTQSFEIYKDNVLLATTTNQYYVVTQNGSYKVKQISNYFEYADSDFSNVVVVSNLYHITYNLPYNTTCNTSIGSQGTNLDSFYIVYNDTPLIATFTISNINVQNSYVFRDTGNISLYTGSCNFDMFYTSILQFKISISDITSDLVFDIINYDTINLNGSYAFIGSQNYSYDNLPTAFTLIFDFTSHNTLFKSFSVDTNTQSVLYNLKTPIINGGSILNYYTIFNYNYDVANQYFAFVYIPQNTGDYLFISIDNQYLDVDLYFNYFVKYFRVATLQDYENLGYQNGVIEANQYTMANLIFALADTPVKLVKGLLNFNFFGVNLFGLFSLLVTILCVWAMFYFIKGGKSNDKK